MSYLLSSDNQDVKLTRQHARQHACNMTFSQNRPHIPFWRGFLTYIYVKSLWDIKNQKVFFSENSLKKGVVFSLKMLGRDFMLPCCRQGSTNWLAISYPATCPATCSKTRFIVAGFSYKLLVFKFLRRFFFVQPPKSFRIVCPDTKRCVA